MTIEAIVVDVFKTRVLTFRQQVHLHKLLITGQWRESDLISLRQLFSAIQEGTIVSGGNSLKVVVE